MIRAQDMELLAGYEHGQVLNLADYQLKQEQAHRLLWSEVDELYYGGAAFGGKTEFGVRFWSQFCLRWPGAQIAVFRRFEDDLHQSLIPRFRQLLDPAGLGRYFAGEMRYQFDNGSTIWFLHCQDEAALKTYDTTQWHGLWFEEASAFTRRMWLWLSVRTRPSTAHPEIPIKKLLTSNPDGPGNDWLCEFFHDPDPAGVGTVQTVHQRIEFEGVVYESDLRRAFLRARFADNPRGVKAYPQVVAMLNQLDPDDRAAKMEGDHTRPFGQFFRRFRLTTHCVEPFRPSGTDYLHWRAIDFGFSPDPFCCLWLAQHRQSGRIVVWQELVAYEADPAELKAQIRALTGNLTILATYADTSAKAQKVIGLDAPHRLRQSEWDIFGRAPNPVPLSPPSKQRVPGWRAVQSALRVLPDDQPLLTVTANCPHLLAAFPKVVHHERIHGDTAPFPEPGVDDPLDALRYGLATPSWVTSVLVQGQEVGSDRPHDTPRAAVSALPAGPERERRLTKWRARHASR